MKQFSIRIKNLLGSRRFFAFIICFFGFEAIWIALSAAYPQAFDENFHFGLIQTYSHYWLPFLSTQPPGADIYGAVTRDPSYLYHYLMSFPYRLIALFIHNQVTQIIILRVLNIGLFALGIVIFRRVLLRVGLSRPLTNTSLFLFTLIPIAPQLAAQINYDNLLIPMIGWVCLLTFQMIDELKQRKPTAKTLITLIVVCFLTSLVQYEFLPIFVGVILFLLVFIHKTFPAKKKLFIARLKTSWEKQSNKLKVGLLIMLLVSVGFFVQRDGVNLIKYHTVSPNCASVLNVNDCSAYSVWEHDYVSHLAVIGGGQKVNSNPILYLEQWCYWIWYRLFFAVNGPVSSFTNYPPLPLPAIAFVLVSLLSLVGIFLERKRIFRNPYIVFLSLISVFYIVALILDGFLEYRYTDVLELMNGRYLLPILLMLAAVAGIAISISLRKTPYLKAVAAVIVIIFFLQGGGFFTFISRSDSSWDWPNDKVVKVNDAARRITDPIIVNGKKTYTTSLWFFN